MPPARCDMAVVILNWNAGPLLAKAVESARWQRTPVSQIVVVDNGSDDGSHETVEGGGVEVVRLERNIGYAAGMNLGVARTTSGAVVVMNCDAVLHPTFTDVAARVLADQPDWGVVGANVVRIAPEGPTRFWEEPGPWEDDGGVLGVSRDMRVRKLASRVRGPMWKANGACPVIRRAVIDDIGAMYGATPFDPVFDTYGEDVDFAFKVAATGWQTGFDPALVAGHVRSYGSSERVFDKRGRLRVNVVAGRHINAWRHLTARQLTSVAPLLLVQDAALVGYGCIRGDRAAVADVVAAWRRVWAQRSALRRFRRDHPPRPPALAWAAGSEPVAALTRLPAPPA